MPLLFAGCTDIDDLPPKIGVHKTTNDHANTVIIKLAIFDANETIQETVEWTVPGRSTESEYRAVECNDDTSTVAFLVQDTGRNTLGFHSEDWDCPGSLFLELVVDWQGNPKLV